MGKLFGGGGSRDDGSSVAAAQAAQARAKADEERLAAEKAAKDEQDRLKAEQVFEVDQRKRGLRGRRALLSSAGELGFRSPLGAG